MKTRSYFRRIIAAILLVGLLSGFTTTAVLAEAPEKVAAQQGVYYTVRWGDTLSAIAVRHNSSVAAILWANPGILNPNHIYAGTVLFIPTGFPGVIQPPAPPPQPSHCRHYHTVAWGQNLIKIGAWYGVSPFTIAEANQIYNLNRIYAGQRLCIP